MPARRTVPVELQSEATECGLACLSMIASYHGADIGLRELRRRFDLPSRGVTLRQLIDIAGTMGFRARGLRVELPFLRHAQLPCILHCDFKHFVVLAEIHANEATIVDPAVGSRRLKLESISAHFTGVVVQLEPTEIFVRESIPRRSPWRALLGRLRGLSPIIWQLALLAILAEALVLAGPLFLQWLVDYSLPSKDTQLLNLLALIFLVIAIVQGALAATRGWVTSVLGGTVKWQMVENTYYHLLSLPPVYFMRRFLGDIYSRFVSIERLQKAFAGQVLEGVVDGIMSSVLLVVMFLVVAPLAAVTTACVAAFALCRVAASGAILRARREEMVHESKQTTTFLETLRGIQTIRLFGAERERIAVWLANFSRQFTASARADRVDVIARGVTTTLIGAERVITAWFGVSYTIDGRITLGQLFAYLVLKELFLLRAGALLDRVVEIKLLGLEAERLADIVDTPAEEGTDARQAPSSLQPPFTIRARELAFRYSAFDPYLFECVSLDITEGECILISGPSGCGKTTLVKILLGLLVPASGQLTLNNFDPRAIGLRSYRQLFGVVMQDDVLFSGSVSDNVALFDPLPDQERIEDCCRLAGLDDDVRRLPMGYNTIVSDQGGQISGGQRQRVLLARALYRQPRFLVLDEATSNVDYAGESAILGSLRALPIGLVIVSHRTDVAQFADRTVALELRR